MRLDDYTTLLKTCETVDSKLVMVQSNRTVA